MDLFAPTLRIRSCCANETVTRDSSADRNGYILQKKQKTISFTSHLYILTNVINVWHVAKKEFAKFFRKEKPSGNE